jgi:hypothetical protein
MRWLSRTENKPGASNDRSESAALFNRLISTTISRLYPFTSKRFHALLNSLFKVLFNFPSRYLFAIGLVVIFSFRWNLPPTLGCTFKQPDSRTNLTDKLAFVTGLPPTMESQSRDLTKAKQVAGTIRTYATVLDHQTRKRFSVELFPFHSPLLGKF